MLLCAPLFTLSPVLADAPPADVATARRMLKQGQVAQAQAVLEELAAGEPDAEVHRLLGDVYCRQRQWDEAREELRAAIRMDEIADDHLRLGEVYIAEHKYALALAQFRNARRMGVLDGDLHYRLALAYFGLGRIYGDVQRVSLPSGSPGQRVGDTVLIEEIPGEPGMYWAAATDSAAFQVTRARSLGADGPEVRLLEARTWLAGRQYALAGRCFDALVEDLPNLELTDEERRQAWTDAAEASYHADDLVGFIARWREAHRTQDRDALAAAMAEAHRRVAERYADRGDLPQCIAHLEQALAEAPRDVPLRYQLGNRYWEAGEPLKAARAWRIVLQLDPEHPDRARILDRLQVITAEYGSSE